MKYSIKNQCPIHLRGAVIKWTLKGILKNIPAINKEH